MICIKTYSNVYPDRLVSVYWRLQINLGDSNALSLLTFQIDSYVFSVFVMKLFIYIVLLDNTETCNGYLAVSYTHLDVYKRQVWIGI